MMKEYRNHIIIGITTLVAGVIIGAFFFGNNSSIVKQDETQDHADEIQTTWTCSMHPQIRQSEPGQCPICGMNLIPLEESNNAGIDPDAIQMTERAMKLADVQTSIVGLGSVSKSLRLTGKVMEDERLVFNQTAHFPGRIEALFVNFTGEYISRGQKIASIYSPDLVTAQEELFEAQKFGNETLVKSAKKKLKLWKLSDAEIESIVSSAEIMTDVPVRADMSGVVIDKKINLGSHIMEGGVLFEVADLSKVWVVFDAYESDLQWIEKGDSIFFTTPSAPGQIFKAKVTFIDPIINPKTRVALVRTEMDNSKELLKPEMLVKGTLVTTDNKPKQELTIPKSAVMWTGERSVVYVRLATDKTPAFIMRGIELGPALGDNYVVLEGLAAGEEIVTNGTFTIDAAAQLQGKKSMMNPKGGQVNIGHNHGGTSVDHSDHIIQQTSSLETHDLPKLFKDQLTEVVTAYIGLKDALVNSNVEDTKKEAHRALQVLGDIDMSQLKGETHMRWMKLHDAMKSGLETIKTANDIDIQRNSFAQLSEDVIASVKTFGVTGSVIYVMRCPMADNNKGANWLSSSREVLNPYFGEAMLKCGEVTAEIKPKN